jgi:toxin-antitoxin system PIN domain toxin
MSTATEMPTYLLDVNVFIALVWPTHVHHSRARRWWATIDRWATTPLTEAAFLRLCTNAAVVGREVGVAEAREMLSAVGATPGHAFIDDATTLARPAIDLTRVATSSQITDAHLVNLSAANAVVLATLDRRIPNMLEPADRRHVLVLPRED